MYFSQKRFVAAGLGCLLIAGLVAAASPDADAPKGDELLKSMSRKLAAATSFSFSTVEFHDRVNRTGAREQIQTTRDVVVRRPNGFWTRYSGGRDWEIWYDGKILTGISGAKKIYIQHQMPPTLDQTMDTLALRFNMDLPMSDVLYSSPYDAFMDAQTRGGFVGKEVIEGASCNHLVYSGVAADWQLWIGEKDSLPCRLEMTYKTQPGPPFHRITFSKWNLSAPVKDDMFAFKIPAGYSRIPMLERVVLQPQTQTQSQPSNRP